MYYVIFPFLYLFSLLPFFILYGISDFAAFLLGRVFKYRQEVIMNNLSIAFPDKTNKEREQIARRFYHYFTDTLIESIKAISISKRSIEKRNKGSYELINGLLANGKSIHVLGGHQFNWEWGSLLYGMHLNIPVTAIYMPISNKVFNRVFYDLRTRFGNIFVSATEFKTKMDTITQQQYILALGADQNPGDPRNAYWIPFFGRPVPFVTGPEKGAVKNNAAVVFVAFKKIRRGYYSFEPQLVVENAAETREGEITRMYRDGIERAVLNDPPNYLWSHRRFKFAWKEEYGDVLK